MTLVWTRGAADWNEDRVLLAGLADVVHLPCVRLTALPPPPYKQFLVYVVTSPHTLQFFAPPAGATVHVFGAATARAAAGGGVRVEEHFGVRTAAELAPRLLAALPPGTPVAIPGPEVPAFDLAGSLRAGGLAAEALPCYRTEAGARTAAGAELSSTEARDFLARTRGVACFASPSAVRGFLAVFGGAGALAAACIGPTTAAAAAGAFARVVTAEANAVTSLVAAAAPLA